MTDKKKRNELTFAAAMRELELLAESLESDTADIDEGVKKFERGLELITDLKKRLQKTESVIKDIKTRYRDVLTDEV